MNRHLGPNATKTYTPLVLRPNDPDDLPAALPAHVPAPNRWLFLRRALRLRCPECGVSPIFKSLRQTRTLDDWLLPLPGCPRCGYAYEREPGYFLLATWGVHYLFVAGFGLALGLILERWLPYDIWLIAGITAVPTILLGFFFARHAKAIYLAIDHYYDPQRKG